MQDRNPRRGQGAASLTCVMLAGAVLASCASQPAPKAKVGRSKEYFAESEYGVKASPRVTNKRSNLPRGGGRDQLGKPYKVKGKWYYPKEDKKYSKVGAASWYGDAFHGRLTANGEIYDMTHLTAAHPTMPLPSYARVTNTMNGNSIIVRVNDRGPYAHNRVIDLSKRAAEMLDYTHVGVAKVKVEYVGRAPLEGRDDQYLMASYRPGKGSGSDLPEGEIATGVMIAMNGPSPSAGIGAKAPALAFPGQIKDVAPPRPAATMVAMAVPAPAPATAPSIPQVPPVAVLGADDPVLPALGPTIPERPLIDFLGAPVQVAALSYADERVARASGAFSAFAGGMTPSQIVASWGSGDRARDVEGADPFIAAGTFASREEATGLVEVLSQFGRAELVVDRSDGTEWYTVNLYEDGRASLDGMLEQSWAAGAADAIVVRE